MSNSPSEVRPRSVLICHAESRLNREGVGRWLASFTDLAGVVLIREGSGQTARRLRFEKRRIGWLRLLDVFAFRLYYRLRLAKTDAVWVAARLDALGQQFPPVPASTRVLETADPNGPDVEAFLRELAPDFALARCKRLLHERIYAVPRLGTFVLHPGVCPEYRNAHGAFWALAEDDLTRVGLTLLKVDKGIDTGPVYGYFFCRYDEVAESHIVVMTRLVLDNLEELRLKFLEICAGTAPAVDTRGRASGVWGQPWLTRYWQWKQRAQRRRNAGSGA